MRRFAPILLFSSVAALASGGALADYGQGSAQGATSQGATAQSDNGVLLVERNVYVPVNDNGNVGDTAMVVEKRAFIPMDQSGSSSTGYRSAPSRYEGNASNSPDTVFVLVPTDNASSTSASSDDNERHFMVRKQVARNDNRCNKSYPNEQLPSDCLTTSGTGAAAVNSTQAQSGR